MITLAQVLTLLIISGGSSSILGGEEGHRGHYRDHPTRDHPTREHSWDKNHPRRPYDREWEDERNRNDFAATPEPSSVVLLATAVTGVALVSRRTLKRST